MPEEAIYRPSGLKATLHTQLEWPDKVWRSKWAKRWR
jgi:hypothetical protein